MTDASPVWIIDTSSILEIRGIERSTRTALFARLTTLVNEGRLKYPRQVVDELERGTNRKNPDQFFTWAHENARQATTAEPSYETLKTVLARVPKVLDPKKDSGAEEADAYVLAMAVGLKATAADVRVVTDEHRDLPTKMSMGTASGLLAIPSVPLRGFLHAEGIVSF